MSTPIVIDVAAGSSRTIRQGSIGCGALGAFFLRWDDPRGAPWTVRWDELRAVEVSTSGPRQTGAAYGAHRRHAALVRVDLFPRSDVVHPEMAHLREFDEIKGGWRLPLGPNPDLIPRLETAFRTFDSAGVYRGVVHGDGGLS